MIITELNLQPKTLGLILLASGSMFLAWTILCRLILSPVKRIPGPWYLKLTTLFVKYHEFHGTRRVWIHGLHQKYGTTVLLAPNEVSFASATALKQIYSSGGTGFPKTDMYSLFKAYGHTNLFTTLDNKEHREKRKQLWERYSNSSILRSAILDVIKERAEAFVTECCKTNSTDIYILLHGYALDCVSAMLFHPYGTKSIEQGPQRELVDLLSYHDARKALVLERYCPALQQAYQLVTHTPAKGGRSIEDYVWSSMARTDFADFSLMARLLHENKMSVDAIASECHDHITAGIDTTGDTLCFLLWELSQPNQQKRVLRLREELNQKHAENSLDSLPYLDALLQEALRLWAPGTQSLPRFVPAGGREIDGYFVPGGDIVSCQSYTTHRYDEGVFQDADLFVPERWLDPNGDSERGRLFFAFGSGARTCIGRHLAMAEMRALVYAVYTQTRTEPAADMVASMEFDDQILTTRPKGLCCKLNFVSLQK